MMLPWWLYAFLLFIWALTWGAWCLEIYKLRRVRKGLERIMAKAQEQEENLEEAIWALEVSNNGSKASVTQERPS